jgi:hypothetical protein
MKTKVLLVLTVFLISIFLTACNNNSKLDVNGYRAGLKDFQKSMPMDQRNAIQKSVLPNVKP